MTRRQKDPLRPLSAEEREVLGRISRALSDPASHVARAKALLAVADGTSYTRAAEVAGIAYCNRWVAYGQHLYHLAHPARRWLEMASESHLVQDRDCGPQTQRASGGSDRPGSRGEENLIEQAYRWAESLGLSLWTQDEAGPFQTVPYAGQTWGPEGQPRRRPHEYARNDTAKVLTLFHPGTGQVRIKGVTSCTNAVLRP